MTLGRSAPAVADQPPSATRSLTDDFKSGLEAPICLTWELTYACNLACRHCLSSSGRRNPAELSTEECFGVVDELQRLGVFYVNLGGGEPMLRRDFFDIVNYSTDHQVGVKFSTNGTYIDASAARRLASMDYLDIQVSIDGATEAVNDNVRGDGSFASARAAMDHLAAADFGAFKISVVVTRQNVDQLDDFRAIADEHGAQLRITRLRPSGRGADTWDELHPTQAQQRDLYHWLLDRPDVLTGDSFFHLNALGSEQLPGLNLCGAGRVVCLIDPIGDVYACPFVIHDEFLAGNVRDAGGFTGVWKGSDLFTSLREPTSAGACASCGAYDACQGGCMASKFFVGLEMDDPDPECVLGHGETLLEQKRASGQLVGASAPPRPSQDHSRPGATVPVSIATRG
ncbi:MAG: mycofactocin radical SAM maturase [Candidatus Microthrix sp.]|uniref:Mycofactocin maturase MftC n=1 Tax=Candidatus Neomicrothrix subdominans TaxID=2954438 RepID=A0A936TD32_9ACTN|nr:mycofactocin radical SAM maturase [Candidatus Microthrix sp.]MBK7165688.1 mycofactocin radical SAM maturase [Candidatus Microthrix sp.]MBK9295647.1 mycofactocin radical SAM maturase [Candidatus Microthrix subdominans]